MGILRDHRRTDGHVNSMTKSAQGADSIKIELLGMHFTKLLRLYCFKYLKSENLKSKLIFLEKGHRTIADLRYREKDTISPSTLIFGSIKG